MKNSRSQVLDWAEKGLIEPHKVDDALSLTGAKPSKLQWRVFLQQCLLWLGICAISLGVIFFFAYNWQNLGRMFKFALIEVIIVINVIFYLKFKAQGYVATALLVGLSLLIGAMLALYHQAYQTGADPWQLMATWTVLITPIALIARSSILWVIWVGLINLSLNLYFEQSNIYQLLHLDIQWITFILNCVLCIAFELMYRYQSKLSLNNRIAAQVCMFAAGSILTLMTFSSIFDGFSIDGLYLLIYFLWISAALVFYSKYISDLFILSAAILSVIFVSATVSIRLIDDFNEGVLLLICVQTLAITSVGAMWLKSLLKKNDTKESENEQ